MHKDPPNSLTSEEWLEVVHGAASVSTNETRVILFGGEPFLHKDRVFKICERARSLGMQTSVITNASLLEEEDFFSLLERGPDIINLSIDTPLAELHDNIRGMPGAFAKTLQFLKKFKSFNHTQQSHRKIQIDCIAVVSKSSLATLEEHIYFLRESGFDGVFFNVLSPTLKRKGASDPYFEKESKFYAQELSSTFQKIKKLKRGMFNEFIRNSLSDLDLFAEYLENPTHDFSRAVCNSLQTVFVDPSGEVGFCNYTKDFIEPKGMGNVREKSIANIWQQPESKNIQHKMQACTKPCGAHGCHRI